MVAFIVAVVVLLVGIGVFFALRGPLVPKDLEPLREPKMQTLPPLKMLAIEARGQTAGEAAASGLGKLFRTYFRVPGAPRRMIGAPRGRWVAEPGGAWRARLGIPVPDAVASLPEGAAAEGVVLETWEYGETAAILHVGPYDTESADVQRLHEFIRAAGAAPSEDHEEEYVRGPGMFGAGNRNRYLTVIRYRVRKQ
jgi:hypothetical protein